MTKLDIKYLFSQNYKIVVKKVYKRKVYKILVVKGRTHQVIEKIGSFDPVKGNISLNNFRLLIWMSRNVGVHWRLFVIFGYCGYLKYPKN